MLPSFWSFLRTEASPVGEGSHAKAWREGFLLENCNFLEKTLPSPNGATSPTGEAPVRRKLQTGEAPVGRDFKNSGGFEDRQKGFGTVVPNPFVGYFRMGDARPFFTFFAQSAK